MPAPGLEDRSAIVAGGGSGIGRQAAPAAEHAVVGLTENAALEHSTQGVRANAVGPGSITPRWGTRT